MPQIGPASNPSYTPCSLHSSDSWRLDESSRYGTRRPRRRGDVSPTGCASRRSRGSYRSTPHKRPRDVLGAGFVEVVRDRPLRSPARAGLGWFPRGSGGLLRLGGAVVTLCRRHRRPGPRKRLTSDPSRPGRRQPSEEGVDQAVAAAGRARAASAAARRRASPRTTPR